MSDDFREKLARRLAELFVMSLKESQAKDFVEMPFAFYDMGTLADEVIRLMEWARQWESGRLPEDKGPLTLPPDDWKP